MRDETAILREQLIAGAVDVLWAGKGHLGVINYIRLKGGNIGNAKKLSYDIFDEARVRLMRRQRIQIIIGWILIAAGVALPIIMFVMHARVMILTTAPILAGIAMLAKVIRPSRLPEQ